MADTLVTSGLPLSSGVEEGTFPPMYYDSPSVQMVIGCTYTADDSLTASVSAGAPYFTVNKIDICNWEVVRTTPGAPGGELPVKLGGAGLSNAVIPVQSQRILSAPVASSNGLTPLTIKAEQYARLWVSARVPRGALPAGPFKGKAALQGKTLSKTVELEGTYLGNLIGSVTVEPATVAPGQPVLVQVLNASGRPYSDSSVTVSIQCVEATARYYQFATPGDRTLTVRAVRGSLSETAKAIVKVAGNPLSYRCALTDPPLSQMPILEVRQTLGQPYQATFTLGTPRWMLKKLAAQLAAASPAAVTPTPRSMRPIAPAPTSSFADDVSKALATLSPTDLKQVPSKRRQAATTR